MNQYTDEVSTKLEFIRQTLKDTGAQGVHLCGTDWFAWITAGASNTVLLTAETGIASVLVTAEDAWVLTDEIEAQRLQDEELPSNLKLHIYPWANTTARKSFICDATEDREVLSDRPVEKEKSLPASLQQYKRVMISSELERYREVGRKASAAMTEVLLAAKPTWTEYELAGAGAEALWARGLHPALTLVAGERRLPLYRHATATNEPIGRQAMMVFCARGYGLYANLTRFVSFGTVPNKESELHCVCREVESIALNMCKPGIALNEVYQALAEAYEQHGFSNAIREHHQGGTTGYLAREIVANPTTTDTLKENMAVAWNPSLVGAKIEDTFVITSDGKLENLTYDANFPSVEVEERLRPVVLEV
ncbi:peptidase M24 [Calothrix sp. HK-06]|nr:peptidase M24 [Calothrix sp. HK-06]